MKRTALVVLLVAAAAVSLLYCVRFALPTSALGGPAAERPLLLAGAYVKLFCLAAAALFALRCVSLLDAANPARTPWLVLSAGLVAFTLGQATLAYYQTLHGKAPFPSIADVWFVISYPLLAIALVLFTIAYTKSGFTASRLGSYATAVTVVMAVVAYPLLKPIVSTPAEPLAMALNVGYPVLDLLLLIPTLVLLRLASRFRGGAVWRLWSFLVAGFVFTAFGDLAFAYVSTFGNTRIDPLVHALYIAAYASLVAGAHAQYEMLAPEAEPVAVATAG